MNKLNTSVIGQHEAKRKVLAAFMMHILRTAQRARNPDVMEFPSHKTSVLLMGPTGVGKTLTIETLAKAVNMPFVKIDATQITPSGYVGKSIGEAIFSQIEALSKTFTAKQLKYTIVFIDEVDKLATGGSESSFYAKIQSTLLRIIEGTELDKLERKPLHTNHMMFIFAGNFEKIRKLREVASDQKTIGFTEVNKTLPKDVDVTEELIKFGMLGELVGRMSVVTQLQDLTKEDYRKVLVESDVSPYRNYVDTLKTAGIDANLSESEITNIVERAIKKKTGLRSLVSLVAEAFEDKILTSKYWEGENIDE